ncbi:MAG TPA: hypothetical protein V6D47_19970 [Oscillatoriaceae cyanobacterium]
MKTSSDRRPLVVVLGMHRSGTSAVTQGLEALGVSLGTELLPANFDNPKGFFEDLRVFDLNERVLGVFGLSWSDLPLITSEQWQSPHLQALRLEARELLQTRLAQYPLWGFKDPRTVRVLPFWNACFEELQLAPRYLVSIRNPLSVVKSLARRDGMSPEWAHLLWLVHMVPYLTLIREHPHVVVDFDRLLSAPPHELGRIARALDLTPDMEAVERYAAEFLSSGLRNSTFQLDDLAADPHLDGLSLQGARLLDALSRDEGADAFWPEWQSLAGSLQGLAPLLRFFGNRENDGLGHERNALLARQADLTRQIDYLRGELAARESLIEALYARLEQAGQPAR